MARLSSAIYFPQPPPLSSSGLYPGIQAKEILCGGTCVNHVTMNLLAIKEHFVCQHIQAPEAINYDITYLKVPSCFSLSLSQKILLALHFSKMTLGVSEARSYWFKSKPWSALEGPIRSGTKGLEVTYLELMFL